MDSATRHNRTEAFFAALTALRRPGCFNPWSEAAQDDASSNGPQQKRERLRAHINRPAKIILLGEAAGYQGARTSGCAFTSERLMLAGAIPGICLTDRLSTRPLPWSEPSATIVWGQLHRLGIADQTILWNSFPLHPHRTGEPYSNRAPTDDDYDAGAHVLQLLVAAHPAARLISVGEKARACLERLGIAAPKIRHPANGGAKKFAAGLEALVRAAPP